MQKITLAVLILFICSVSYSQNISYIYINSIPSTAEKYQGDFLEVSNNVNTKFTHLKDKNIDGVALQNKYLALVKNAKTNLEYGDILLRYFAELKNGHSTAIFKKYYKDCSASLIENRVFLSYVNEPEFIKNGVKEKDEIVKINDMPVMDFIKSQAKYTSASTDLHRTYLTVSGLFSSYYEENRTYTIKTSSGNRVVSLRFADRPVQSAPPANSKPATKIEGKVLNSNVAYIAITSMTENVVNDFISAYESLSNKPFLIVDLRKNQGGNSGNSEKIAEYLITKEQTASVSGRRLKPKDTYYKGKLFVLTSPYTFSAGESFALDLLESGNATLIGLPTGGDTGNQPRFYKSQLGYSYWFPSRNKAQISEKGFPMEGRSIEPQYRVFRTVGDYLKGEDTILNFTLSLIDKQ